MKKTIAILFALCCVVPALAQEKTDPSSPESTAGETEKPALAYLPSKLAEMKQINDAKVKQDAKYYIILSSASWCGPCRAEAPKVVEQYKKISQDPDVELVLFSSDRDEAKALEWAGKENMTYPIFMDREKYRTIPAVKDNKPGYIPHAMILDKDGKLVANEADVKKDGKEFSAIVDAEGKVLKKGGTRELIEHYKEFCK